MKRAILAVLTLAAATPAVVAAELPRSEVLRHVRGPGIRLWTNGEVYRRHERARVYFRTEQDAFVLIFRVDTDGRLSVLFPRRPDEDNFVYGGRTQTVANYGRDAFYVDDYPGLGYVFGVAASDPFDLEQLAARDRWDIRLVAEGRIHADPYGELHDLVGRLLPEDYSDYDTHLLPYYVERRYDYPRFVCYDCHAWVSWALWDPYRYWCSRYTLVVYNDPFYYYPSYWYPTRYYGGTRVVYVRPGARDGRFVFRTRESTAPAIEYRDRRTSSATAGIERRPADRGVRGVDIGGVGSVEVPGRRLVGEVPGARGGDDRIPVIGGRRTTDVPAPRTPDEPVVEPRRRVDQPQVQEPPPARALPERRSTDTPAPGGGRTEPRAFDGGRRGVAEQPPAGRQPDAERAAPDGERRPPDAGRGATTYRVPPAVRPPSDRPGGRATVERPQSEPRREAPPRSSEPRASAPPRSEPRQAAPAPRSQPEGRPSGGLVRRRP